MIHNTEGSFETGRRKPPVLGLPHQACWRSKLQTVFLLRVNRSQDTLLPLPATHPLSMNALRACKLILGSRGKRRLWVLKDANPSWVTSHSTWIPGFQRYTNIRTRALQKSLAINRELKDFISKVRKRFPSKWKQTHSASNGSDHSLPTSYTLKPQLYVRELLLWLKKQGMERKSTSRGFAAALFEKKLEKCSLFSSLFSRPCVFLFVCVHARTRMCRCLGWWGMEKGWVGYIVGVSGWGKYMNGMYMQGRVRGWMLVCMCMCFL